MYLKALIFNSLFILCLNSYGQETYKYDLRSGLGTSLLTSGDMLTVFSESEINYYHGSKMSSSLSVALGKSNQGVNESTSYAQINLSTFYSPFERKGRNDLRIGIGLSHYKVNDTYFSSGVFQNNVLVELTHTTETRRSSGLSFALEKSWELSQSTFWALKIFTQPYFNGDANSGLMLKFGVAW